MEVSLLASVSRGADGANVVLWDMNKRKIYSRLQMAHEGKQISDVVFLTKEPVLVTASAEGNAVKMWLFERGLMVPRLLR